MLASILLMLAVTADPTGTTDPQIQDCVIASIDDQYVPGADAGVLTHLKASEGMQVTRGMELGLIDESEARANLDVKQLEYEAATQKANSDINIRHAKAAADVAQAALRQYEEANRRAPGTVSHIDILKSKLELKKAELATEQTMEEQIENQLTAKAKKAEVGAAQVALDRRILRAPFDGVITSVIKKPGEWVASGEPVVQVVGIKRLRVMGNLDASQWGPTDIAGRDVTVEVQLPRGRAIKVPGTVTYVSPVVTLGHLPVYAEIDATMENDLPVVRAGLKASMTIHVSRPVAATPRKAPVHPAASRGQRN